MPTAYRDLPVQLAFCIGFVLSITISFKVFNGEQQHFKAKFLYQSNQLAAVLQQNIDSYNSENPPLNILLKTSLRDLHLEQINFYIYEQKSGHKNRFLAFYESSNQIIVLDSGGQEPVYTANHWLCTNPTICTRTLKVGNRQWSLLLLPTPSYASLSYYWRTWTTLVGGIILTTIVMTYLLMSLKFTSWNEMLEILSMTDQLTGLLNRRAMDMAVTQMLQQIGENSASTPYRYLSVLIIDIDHFKRVNDTWGHLVGDCVLKAVAGRLKANVRSGSWLYRYGGEEFVCITPGLSPQMTYEYGDFLRLAIANELIAVSDDVLVSITISIGGVTASCDNKLDSQTLFAQADIALYKAKEEGRNCLRMS